MNPYELQTNIAKSEGLPLKDINPTLAELVAMVETANTQPTPLPESLTQATTKAEVRAETNRAEAEAETETIRAHEILDQALTTANEIEHASDKAAALAAIAAIDHNPTTIDQALTTANEIADTYSKAQALAAIAKAIAQAGYRPSPHHRQRDRARLLQSRSSHRHRQSIRSSW